MKIADFLLSRIVHSFFLAATVLHNQFHRFSIPFKPALVNIFLEKCNFEELSTWQQVLIIKKIEERESSISPKTLKEYILKETSATS